MPNTITNTAIVNRSHYGRGLITHHANTSNVVRETDGTLWAAVLERYQGRMLNVYKSVDDGFSWIRHASDNLADAGFETFDVAGYNQNGPFISLQVFEQRDEVVVWFSYKEIADSKTYASSVTIDRTTPNVGELTRNDDHNLNADQLAVKAVYSDQAMFLVYTSLSQFKVKVLDLIDPDDNGTTVTIPGAFFNVFDAVTRENGTLNCVFLEDNSISHTIKHVVFNTSGMAFGTPTTVYNNAGSANVISDLAIRYDGSHTLAAVWSELAGSEINVKYSISTSNGTAWSSPVTIEKSAGHGNFTDQPTGQLAGRATLLGGLSGFAIGYTRINAQGIPKSFVRVLTTSDGETYTLGAEREVATQNERVETPIAGLKFFEPPSTKLLDISDPGVIRIAYQAGEGTSTTSADSIPVKFGQELLRESAYPIVSLSEAGAYQIDPVGPSQILCTLTVMSGPRDNIDYYAAGVTGNLTNRYMAAFRKAGTEVRLLKYEPNEYAYMNDRSAFSFPSEYITLAIFAPMTYELPFSQGQDQFTTYIERDIRKIHLPPSMHLSREFVLNNGNFLKRTVWTVLFDGNEYELSQVVPYFVSGQITHYTANAYVVGPSNNPFSRTVLPSET